MTAAPEKIWAHPTEREPRIAHDKKNAPWKRGRWKDHDSGAHGDVCYTRTDLAEAAERAAYLRGLEDAAKRLDVRAAELHRLMQYYASERLKNAAKEIRALAKEGGE